MRKSRAVWLVLPLLLGSCLAPRGRVSVQEAGASSTWLRARVEEARFSEFRETWIAHVPALSGHPLLPWTRSGERDDRQAVGVFLSIPSGLRGQCDVPESCGAYVELITVGSWLGLDATGGTIEVVAGRNGWLELRGSLELQPVETKRFWPAGPWRVTLEDARLEEASDESIRRLLGRERIASMTVARWQQELGKGRDIEENDSPP